MILAVVLMVTYCSVHVNLKISVSTLHPWPHNLQQDHIAINNQVWFKGKMFMKQKSDDISQQLDNRVQVETDVPWYACRRKVMFNLTQNGMVFKHWHIPDDSGMLSKTLHTPHYGGRDYWNTFFWSHANCLLKNVSLKYQTFFWKFKQRLLTKHVLHQHYVHFVDQRPYYSWYKLEWRVQTRSYCSLCE